MEISCVKGGIRLKAKYASCDVGNTVIVTRNDGTNFVIDSPGEYEIGGVSVVCNSCESKNLYVVEIENLRICILPELVGDKLTPEILDALGSVDICAGPNSDLSKQTDPWVVIAVQSEGNPKYVITHDKLPSELQVVVLAAK